MPFLDVSDDSAVYYNFHAPAAPCPTFVFVNSMGANTEVWEAEIGPALRARGYGTLTLDYRGQGQTRYGDSATLLPDEIVGDVAKVIAHVAPPRPILVGLSIGGLFAMRAYLQGVAAEGLVLINTLRKPGAMVDWIIELEGRLLSRGGMDLLMDVFRPMLCSPKELTRLRPTRLLPGAYTSWPAHHPRHRLGAGVRFADWDVPYEDLKLPVLVLTGVHDRLFRIQDDVDELAARLPDGTVVNFPEAGHALHEEDTEGFIEALTTFARGMMGGSPLGTASAQAHASS